MGERRNRGAIESFRGGEIMRGNIPRQINCKSKIARPLLKLTFWKSLSREGMAGEKKRDKTNV